MTEYYEALRWYAEAGPHLALRFARAVEETVMDIANTPMRFPIVHKDRRRAGVWRFPYGLFFLVENDRIVVIACFHGKRNPHRWKRR